LSTFTLHTENLIYFPLEAAYARLPALANGPGTGDERRRYLHLMSASYAYLLRFRLLSDAPSDVRKRYKDVYDDILSGDRERFEPYLQSWIGVLQDEGIGTSVDTQLLNRCEGGIGGSTNKTDRQIRFYNDLERSTTFKRFGEITLRSTDADDKSAVWTVEDLSAFGEAFKDSLEAKVSPGCIDFYVAFCPLSV
jgi:hypothetical protein